MRKKRRATERERGRDRAKRAERAKRKTPHCTRELTNHNQIIYSLCLEICWVCWAQKFLAGDLANAEHGRWNTQKKYKQVVWYKGWKLIDNTHTDFNLIQISIKFLFLFFSSYFAGFFVYFTNVCCCYFCIFFLIPSFFVKDFCARWLAISSDDLVYETNEF